MQIISAQPQDAPRNLHRMRNNRGDIWFHAPAAYVKARPGVPCAAKNITPVYRRRRGFCVISAKDTTPSPAPDAGDDTVQPEGRTTTSQRSNKAGKAEKRPLGSDVGDALRAVYREAVAEDVPDEMLDLLNKLG